jgi:hypothetical protein
LVEADPAILVLFAGVLGRRGRARSNRSGSASGTSSHMNRWPVDIVQRCQWSALSNRTGTEPLTVRTSVDPASESSSSTPVSEANGPPLPEVRASRIAGGRYGPKTASTGSHAAL